MKRNSSIISEKQKIRKRIKNILDKIDEEKREYASLKVFENFVSLYKRFSIKERFLIYSSKSPEIKTEKIIEFLKSKKKKVFLPKIVDKEIFPARFTNFNKLIEGKYNILEPEDKYIEKDVKLDVIIVPGIAFDLKGNRLGRGKGYFDRFLSRNKGSLKIGLAYEFQILDNLPFEETDEKVDFVITERRIIRV